MRLFVVFLSLILASCSNLPDTSNPNTLARHCPFFSGNNWSHTQLPQSQQLLFINKQEFAVPTGYQTAWFKSTSNSIGLCIVPDKKNRGASYGCGSAYAEYSQNENMWVLDDQKVTICSL